jgi:hypothetical protein
MPASEAQILANRRNAEKSTGPKTVEGKERSRANAIKHGLTGEGVALTPEVAAEVDRKTAAFEASFRPEDEPGRVLIRRAAVCAVRMERAVVQETAALSERVEKARAEAEANGEDPEEAGNIALFDPSKEACLARKYEAAAERGFFRAIKEFRQHRKSADVPSAAMAEAASARESIERLGSFLPAEVKPPGPAKASPSTPAPAPKPASKPAQATSKTVFPAWKPAFGGSVDVPITIGLAR